MSAVVSCWWFVLRAHQRPTRYRMRRRKEFENSIRRQRQHMGTWIKYAKFEETQKEFHRARSVFERAIDVDYKYQPVWLKYAEMEMRHEFVNRARNVWDRATKLLPRVDQFWYKYSYMEEMVGNAEGARAVFERWMKWRPGPHAWTSFARVRTCCSSATRTPLLMILWLCGPMVQ